MVHFYKIIIIINEVCLTQFQNKLLNISETLIIDFMNVLNR